MLELIKMVGWNSNQMEWKELPYMNDIIEQWHQFVNKLAPTKSLEKKCEKGAEKNFQRRIRIQLWGTFYLWLVLHANRQLFLATYQRKVRIFSGAALQGILHGDQQQVSSWITSMWWHLRKKERERVVKERSLESWKVQFTTVFNLWGEDIFVSLEHSSSGSLLEDTEQFSSSSIVPDVSPMSTNTSD